MLGGTIVVAFILIAPAALIAWGVWEFLARPHLYRLGWVICGIAGVPALAFGILYFFGIPVIAFAFVLGAVLAISRRFDHVVSAAYIGGYRALGVVTAMRDVTGWEWGRHHAVPRQRSRGVAFRDEARSNDRALHLARAAADR